jgi:predicted subunit of tRNA(5-methylaminomethyl-2-thiouridylate) methyltransferase
MPFSVQCLKGKTNYKPIKMRTRSVTNKIASIDAQVSSMDNEIIKLQYLKIMIEKGIPLETIQYLKTIPAERIVQMLIKIGRD